MLLLRADVLGHADQVNTTTIPFGFLSGVRTTVFKVLRVGMHVLTFFFFFVFFERCVRLSRSKINSIACVVSRLPLSVTVDTLTRAVTRCGISCTHSAPLGFDFDFF